MVFTILASRDMRSLLVALVIVAVATAAFGQSTGGATGNWKAHTVYQLNGSAPPIKLPSRHQLISETWGGFNAAPYMVFMPEKNRALMTFLAGPMMVTHSDDFGATWSELKPANASLGLTYLGNGKLLTMGEQPQCKSEDYGETWKLVRETQTANGKPAYSWDPALVDRDKTGKVIRLTCTCYVQEGPNPWNVQAYLKFSTDQGETWSEPVRVPEWVNAAEVALVRAKNGEIVAACRTENPAELGHIEDHYSGLGVSISRDNGKTWSKINKLYNWGRHHPSMVLLPNGNLVLTYVVRRGYPNTPDGRSQFGIEAIVSRDNGANWDLDHKYILDSWKGNHGRVNAPQCTSTVLLPDGSLLTTFGTGCRARYNLETNIYRPLDVALINWRVSNGKLMKTSRISKARYDSGTRNKFDLNAFNGVRKTKTATDASNIASTRAGVRIQSSSCSTNNLQQLLYVNSDYYYTADVGLSTTPAWVEMYWPRAHTIERIVIFPGDLAIAQYPSTECVPLDYRLQYRDGTVWKDLVPPVTNAPRFADYYRANPDRNEQDFSYTHKFPPISVKAIRLWISRSSDPGRRVSSPDQVTVPPEQRGTILRWIKVYETPSGKQR